MPRPRPLRRHRAPTLALAPLAFLAWAALAAGCRADEPRQMASGPCAPGQFCGAAQAGMPAPGMPTPAAPAPAPAGPPSMGLPCAGTSTSSARSGAVSVGAAGLHRQRRLQGRRALRLDPARHVLPAGAAVAGPSPGPAPPGSPPPAGGFPPAAGSGSFASARQLCVDRTNQLRASVGARPLQRVAAAEPCLDSQAAHDGSVGAAHAAFGRCNEGAQNECPGWAGPPDSMVGPCLKMMFDEGPGAGAAHGHYTNMVEGKYSGVACGFSVLPDGRVWMVQDFF
ncbi:MAG: hypothetical protein WKG00_06635 [Polyangiaceae bacterium]